MPEPMTPTTGVCVLHLFARVTPGADRSGVEAAVKTAEAGGVTVVPISMIGHRADLGLMALGGDVWSLRCLQSDLSKAGLTLSYSYFSVTEVSEYATSVPDEMKQARLYPVLPPDGKRAWCFYPMSKRRTVGANWYALDYETRESLMLGHGRVGRQFAGKILQVITASTGLDNYEWGVTLFGVAPDDIKECVYLMRFDEGSSVYADFGPFYSGIVDELDAVLNSIGLL